MTIVTVSQKTAFSKLFFNQTEANLEVRVYFWPSTSCFSVNAWLVIRIVLYVWNLVGKSLNLHWEQKRFSTWTIISCYIVSTVNNFKPKICKYWVRDTLKTYFLTGSTPVLAIRRCYKLKSPLLCFDALNFSTYSNFHRQVKLIFFCLSTSASIYLNTINISFNNKLKHITIFANFKLNFIV